MSLSNHQITKPVLVTGAGGTVGGVSNYVIDMLRKEGVPVRAIIRKEDERAVNLRAKGVEVVIGDLTILSDVHKAIERCGRVYFSVSVSSQYLEAALLTITVAKHHNIELFVNMSQMTAAMMNIERTVPSPQAKAHWLVEQSLQWSGVPFINVQPTIFMENPHFNHWAKEGIIKNNEWRTPLANTRVNPIAAHDVARVVAKVLLDPTPHLGKGLKLVGRSLQTPEEIAKEYSAALGRDIKYTPIPADEFKRTVIDFGVEHGYLEKHTGAHLHELAKLLNTTGRQVETKDVELVTGVPPIGFEQWVREYSDFK